MSHQPPTAGDARFVGSIPEFYHSYLGPLLFADYAEDLARRVKLPDNSASVLELAAGTGILTERLHARHPHASLVVTDLNEPMLEIARRRIGEGPGITWRAVDATELPFGDAEFDAVVCQFGVMFFPDRPAAARETYRVLKPGGQWLFSVWGSFVENGHGRLVHETITGFFPDDPPQFYRVPFSLHDPAELRALVRGAGFEEPEVTTLGRMAEAPSAGHAAIGLVRGNPVLNAGENPERLVQAVAEALAREFGDHPLRFPTRVHVVSARRH